MSGQPKEDDYSEEALRAAAQKMRHTTKMQGSAAYDTLAHPTRFPGEKAPLRDYAAWFEPSRRLTACDRARLLAASRTCDNE